MSEIDFVEATSDSFWEVGQYKRTVKRCEDGHKLCNDMIQMIAERADIEKSYSKSLKAWSKKWNDYLLKGSEYGTMKATWTASLNEADKLAEIHSATHGVLTEELNGEIKTWQKENYLKSLVNQLKIAKEYEEEFKKAQKPWAKKYAVVEKCKKDYHAACKSFQAAKVQAANAQNDNAISLDQKKKLEDKVEKYKKEVEITKNKYKQALDDLNSCNARYMDEMNSVYKKCDQFEKKRLEFFIEKFVKLHGHLNIAEKNIEDIYSEFLTTIRRTNPERDLLDWSKDFGNNMPMNWPSFVEYSDDPKPVAKAKPALVAGGGRALNNQADLNNNSSSIGAAGSAASAAASANKGQRGAADDDDSSRNLSHNDSNSRFNADPWSDSPGYGTQASNDFNSFDEYNQQTSWNNHQSHQANPFGDDDDQQDSPTKKQQPTMTTTNDDSDEENAGGGENGDHHQQNLNIKVRALYDYDGVEADELSFKAGEDFIQLSHEDDKGWCLGKLGSKVGLYPATYATTV